MGNDTGEMGFADGCDFQHFRNAADVGKRGADIVDIVIFDQLVEVPAVAPFLAGRDRYADFTAEEWDIFEESLRANRIFDKIGREITMSFVSRARLRLGQSADGNRRTSRHFSRRLRAPGHNLRKAGSTFVCVVGRVGRAIGSAHAKGSITGGDGELCTLFDAHAWLESRDAAGGVIALTVVTHGAAENLMDRKLEHFAFEIPERQVQGSDGVFFLRPAG